MGAPSLKTTRRYESYTRRAVRSDVFGLEGCIIDDQFAVHEAVGSGGFSTVYRATHLGLAEPVAIKCLAVRTHDTEIAERILRRFRLESRLAYRLSQGHLDIVRAITAGTILSPRNGCELPYTVFEWLDGETLDANLRARRASGSCGRSPREVRDLFAPAASALSYAHTRGVVHGDVKPANLFLHGNAARARMKVLDFGMAKILEPERVGGMTRVMTLDDIIAATMYYAAPEQLDPTFGERGTWTDVYAFALVLLEALTDQRARRERNLVDVLLALRDPTRAPSPRFASSIDERLASVLEVALDVRTDRRFRNLGEMWSAFETAVDAIGELTSSAVAGDRRPSTG